jgi:hypothetical protein
MVTKKSPSRIIYIVEVFSPTTHTTNDHTWQTMVFMDRHSAEGAFLKYEKSKSVQPNQRVRLMKAKIACATRYTDAARILWEMTEANALGKRTILKWA